MFRALTLLVLLAVVAAAASVTAPVAIPAAAPFALPSIPSLFSFPAPAALYHLLVAIATSGMAAFSDPANILIARSAVSGLTLALLLVAVALFVVYMIRGVLWLAALAMVGALVLLLIGINLDAIMGLFGPSFAAANQFAATHIPKI